MRKRIIESGPRRINAVGQDASQFVVFVDAPEPAVLVS